VARIRNVNLIVERNFALEKHLFHLLLQLFHSCLFPRGNADDRSACFLLHLLFFDHSSQIRLIQQHNRLAPFQDFHDFCIILIKRHGCIHHVENQIRVLCMLQSTVHTDFLDHIRRFSDPRRIQNPKGNAL